MESPLKAALKPSRESSPSPLKLRRLKLQGQNLPKSDSQRHFEKTVFMGDPKTQQPKIKQKSINWTIFIYFQENRLPRRKIYLPKNGLLFRKTMTFSFFYHLCFPMKIPMSLQSFLKPVFENHVARSTTRGISWHLSMREASRKH